MSDRKFLKELHTIMNPATIDRTLNIAEIEKQLIQEGHIQETLQPPETTDNELIEELRRAGINQEELLADLRDFRDPEIAKIQSKIEEAAEHANSHHDDGRSLSDLLGVEPQPDHSTENMHDFVRANDRDQNYSHTYGYEQSYTRDPPRLQERSRSQDHYRSQEHYRSQDHYRSPEQDQDVRAPFALSAGSNSRSSSEAVDTANWYRSLDSRTMEQTRRTHIDHVLSDVNFSNVDAYSLEKEKQRDLKHSMLAEISDLRNILEDLGVDLGRIREVDINSDFDDIESTLKLLRYKNDHAQFTHMAEELMMGAATGLEMLFDGERKWFGHFQPDLTGWHHSLRAKFSRIRYDTGQLVGHVVQDIHPIWRLILEIVPSMFLHARSRQRSRQEKDLFNDDDEEFKSARARLRENSRNRMV